MERIVAIVGRPNVGKSALFNRLAGRRISIVHDRPGVTRDRITAECRKGSAPFTIIDTGGIGAAVDADFTGQVRAEVDVAIEAASVILFVVDGRDGLTPLDDELARLLRRTTKPIVLVVNKIDEPKHAFNENDFARLGFDSQIATSAEHGRGIDELIATAESLLPEPGDAEDEATAPATKIAIVGRPNVGKSSLTNAILKDERTLVSPIAGTTRDAVDVPYQRGNKHYVLIDTAGIRHRSKVSDSVEVFSVKRAEASIERADLCCLVIDAEMGVTSQDQKIAGMIQEARKPCIVVVNKWDLVRDEASGGEKLKEFIADQRARLFFIDYAPFVMCSAKERSEMARVLNMIEKVRSGSRARIGTGVLNRTLQDAIASHPPAMRSGRRFKILYATQPERDPNAAIPVPEVVLFCNDTRLLDDSYRRFLEARLRAHAPYPGLPILFRLRPREEKGKRTRRG